MDVLINFFIPFHVSCLLPRDKSLDEEELYDSWSASLINEIPQIDGTFVVEDLIEQNGPDSRIALYTNRGKEKSRKKEFNVSNHRQSIKNISSCQCPCSKNAKNGSKKLEDYAILQVDGSSDTDFLELDSFPRTGRRKTPLRTYEKSARKRMQRTEKRTRDKAGGQSCRHAKAEDTGVGGSEPVPGRMEPALFGTDELAGYRPGGGSEGWKNQGVKDGSKSNETDTKQCSTEKGLLGVSAVEVQSIFSKEKSSSSNADSQENLVLSTKAFYSTSKRLSSRKTISPKGKRRKRLSLKPLDFVHSDAIGEAASKQRMSSLTRSDSTNRRMCFTEIVSDLRHPKGTIEASDKVEARQSSCTTKEVKLRSEDVVINETQNKENATSPLESYQNTRKIKPSYGLTRECYVSLTDIRSHEMPSLHKDEKTNLSKKRKTVHFSQRSSKKTRLKSAEYDSKTEFSFKDFWGCQGGLKIGAEDYSSSDVCDSCCDSLLKASYPSPRSSDGVCSPPHTNSPTEETKFTKIISSPKLPASPFNDNFSDNATDKLTEGQFLAKDEMVKIRFQNDRFCAQIKPVRLNFEDVPPLEAKRCLDVKSGTGNAVDRFLDGQKIKEYADIKRSEDGDFSSINADSNDFQSGDEHRNPEADIQLVNTTLLTEDSPQSFDYCVKFSPIIQDAPLIEKKPNAMSGMAMRKRLGLRRLWVAQKTCKEEQRETYNVPSLGDTTQLDLSLENETCDSGNLPTSTIRATKEPIPSENIDRRPGEAEFSCNEKASIQADDIESLSVQPRPRPIPSSIEDEVKSTPETNDSDNNVNPCESFTVIERKETVLANDSIVYKPETENRNKSDLSFSFRKQSEGSEIFTDKEDGQNSLSVEEIMQGNDVDGVTNETGQSVPIKRQHGFVTVIDSSVEDGTILSSSGDGKGSPEEETTGHSLNLTTISSDVKLNDNQDIVMPTENSQSSPDSAVHNSTIQHSVVRFSANADSATDKIMSSSSLQNESVVQTQVDIKRNSQLDLHTIDQPTVVITPSKKPPSCTRVLETAKFYGLGEIRNQRAFFSDSKDLPSHTR